MNGLAATSIAFLEDLYRRYQVDPTSVDISWRCAFDLAHDLSGAAPSVPLLAELIRQRGHLGAALDPLGRVTDGAEFAHHVEASRHDPDTLRSLYGSSFTVETAHID